MADEYWKDSPFGEDSFFHPSYDVKEEKVRIQRIKENSKIVDVKVVKGNLLEDELKHSKKVKDYFSKEHFPSHIPQEFETQKSNISIVTISVIVEVKGWANDVRIVLKDSNNLFGIDKEKWGRKNIYFTKIDSNEYFAVFQIKATAQIKRDFIIEANLVDLSSKSILDTKQKNISINSNGKLSNIDIQDNIFFNVYFDGRIEELTSKEIEESTEKRVSYFYYDKNNEIHDIGKFKINTIKNIYGSRYGENTIDLLDVRELRNYLSDAVYFRISINTNRYFMNTKTMGSLIGAMLTCSYNDFVFNGFSNESGESIGGSSSHKNGYNGDFRYLRKDMSGKRMDLRESDETGDPCGWKGLDEMRQNQFNDSLYKFGWKSMLSWKYDGDKLLNHCIQYDKHYNHLHVQGYNPNYKKIIK